MCGTSSIVPAGPETGCLLRSVSCHRHSCALPHNLPAPLPPHHRRGKGRGKGRGGAAAAAAPGSQSDPYYQKRKSSGGPKYKEDSDEEFTTDEEDLLPGGCMEMQGGAGMTAGGTVRPRACWDAAAG